MEARQEIKITVKANYRDIVKAVVIEAARLLYKRGVDVKGFKARVKLAQDEVKMPKLIVSFMGEETVELKIPVSPVQFWVSAPEKKRVLKGLADSSADPFSWNLWIVPEIVPIWDSR